MRIRPDDPEQRDPIRFPAVPIDSGSRVYFLRDGDIVGEGRIIGAIKVSERLEVAPNDQRARDLFGDHASVIFNRLTGKPVDDPVLPAHGLDVVVVSRALVDGGIAPKRFGVRENV
jgi:hypothetical protein